MRDSALIAINLIVACAAFDSKGAARRLAITGNDPDLPELQGIASVVLRAPPDKAGKPIEDQEQPQRSSMP